MVAMERFQLSPECTLYLLHLVSSWLTSNSLLKIREVLLYDISIITVNRDMFVVT